MSRTSWSACGARRMGICLALMAAGSVAPVCTLAADNGYLQLKFDKDVVNRQRTVVSKILSGQMSFDGASRSTLQKYYLNVFGEMTQTSAIGRVGDLRRRFLSRLRSAKSPAALSFVNAFSLKATSSIARKTDGKGMHFHPASRVNAVLIMADLDDKLSSGVGPSATPPVPMAKALPQLVQLATDPEMPDGVKVAALLGVRRHARYGISGAQQVRVTDVILEIINQQEPPENRSPEGHEWTRGLAIGIAGEIGTLGVENKTYLALVGVVADETAPQSVRCSAAKALAKFDYGQATDLDVTPAVGDLGSLAIVVLKYELDAAKRLADRADQQRAAMIRSGMFEDNLLGGDDAKEADPAGAFPRRELAARIESIRAGLRALSARVPDEKKELTKGLLTPLDKLFGILEDRRSVESELLRAARTARDQLAENLQAQQPEPAEGDALIEETDRAAGRADEEARPDETGFYYRAVERCRAAV